MKALIYGKDKIFRIGEWNKPFLLPGENGKVILKVILCGICGSDIGVYKGAFKERLYNAVILGHEILGEITDISPDSVGSFSIGDRVAVEQPYSCGNCDACRCGRYNLCKKIKTLGMDVGYNGGFAEYVKVDIKNIHKVPNTLSDERAALCEPMAIAVHMVRQAKCKKGDRALVIGAGPIGVLVALYVKHIGASRVVVCDKNQFRVGNANQFGLDAYNTTETSWKTIADKFSEDGIDVCFEVAGSSETYNLALLMTKSGGTVVCGGSTQGLIPIALNEVLLKELTLIGTRMAVYDDFEIALRVLEKKEIPFEKLISKKIGLDQMLDDGFNMIESGAPLMKILVDPTRNVSD